MAYMVSRSDLDKGIQLLEDVEGDAGRRDRTRYLIAREIVAQDHERAIQLVQSCEEPDSRSQALGRLAVDVAAIDQEQAWRMIDEALAVHRAPHNAFQSWSNYGEGGPFAAALAYQAFQCGYPDMESVIWHALVACDVKGTVKSGQSRLRATIGTARILALIDQSTARALLESISSQIEQIPKRDGGLDLFGQWLQAWLLVDFPVGISLLEEDLQQLEDSGKENALRYGHGAVIRLLAAPPDEQFDILAERGTTGLWDLTLP